MWLLMITFIVFMDANTLIKVTFSHLGNYPKKFISILFQMAWKIIIKDVTYWKNVKLFIYLNVNKVPIIHYENRLKIYLVYFIIYLKHIQNMPLFHLIS
jgi:hypothetical protein